MLFGVKLKYKPHILCKNIKIYYVYYNPELSEK